MLVRMLALEVQQEAVLGEWLRLIVASLWNPPPQRPTGRHPLNML